MCRLTEAFHIYCPLEALNTLGCEQHQVGLINHLQALQRSHYVSQEELRPPYHVDIVCCRDPDLMHILEVTYLQNAEVPH